MNTEIRILLVLVFLKLSFWGCASIPRKLDSFNRKKQKIEKYLQSNLELKTASYSISMIDIKSGREEIAINPNTCLRPASILKLMVCGELLNKANTDETSLRNLETFIALAVDTLVVSTSGMPNFFNEKDSGLQKMMILQNLKSQGIDENNIRYVKYIINEVNERPNSSQWIQEDLDQYYGANTFSFNCFGNTLKFEFNSKGPVGSLADPIINFQHGFKVNSFMKVQLPNATDLGYAYFKDSTVNFYGTVPKKKEVFEIKTSCQSPLYESFFKYLFGRKPLKIIVHNNGISNNKNYFRSLTPILSSNGLIELPKMLKHCLEASDNLYAESFLRYLSLGENSSLQGLQAIRKNLNHYGIDSNGFFMVDACGLSPLNAISSNSFSNLLYKTWIISTQVNTLKYGRLIDYIPNYKTNIKAKTGYTERTRSIAGYILDFNGKPIKSFAVMINNYSGMAWKSRVWIDEIVKILE